MNFIVQSQPPGDKDERRADPNHFVGLSLLVGEVDHAILKARGQVDAMIQSQLAQQDTALKLAAEQVEELAVRAATLCRILSERISEFQQRDARVRS